MGKIWSAEELEFLKENLNKMSCTEIGIHIGRSRLSIRGKMKVEKLKRPIDIQQKLQSQSYFKKDHIPWNKDKKGMHYSPATEFKKGHIPAGTKYDGCITIRKRSPESGRKEIYKFIRIEMGKWQLYHRYIWEKYHGPIPPGYNIRFINGDTLDVRIENLMLVSLKKNMDLNRNYNTDNCIAFLLSPRDKELRKEIKKCPDLIQLKRMQLELRRSVIGTGK